MPDMEMPDYTGTLGKKASRLTSNLMTPTPQNFNLDEGIVKAFNQGTGNDQVNAAGLTYVEDSLLKPWEKAHRIQNRT